jgi:sporulation protein YlmC with PRC-barrel domain
MFKDEDFKENSDRDLEKSRETNDKDLHIQNITGKNEDPIFANTPVTVLTATSIIGDKVENPQGQVLGEIKNIMINIRSGVIEYVVLQFGGFLGIGEKLFAIPFKQLRIAPERQIFILNTDKEFLKKAPGFDQEHWPETNSKHWDDTRIYWESYNSFPLA